MARYIGIDLSRPDRPAAVLLGGQAALIPGAAPLPAGAQTVRQLIQAHLGSAAACTDAPIEGAVLAVPGFFTSLERSAVLDGAKALGLQKVRLISCSAAIGLGYQAGHPDAEGVYASVQIRGAACELALLELGSSVAEVLAIAFDKNAMSVTPDGALTDAAADSIAALLKQALADAERSADQLRGFIPVCGARYLPSLTNVLSRITASHPAPGADPADIIAKGAAVLGGTLDGETKLLCLDATACSLGIETLGGVFTRIIKRSTVIPARESQIFSTAADDQNSVEVHVLQGEGELAAQNTSLGRFMMNGIAPAPKGKPQIEVTFDIDANGIVSVTARDVTGGKDQTLTVTTRIGGVRQAPGKQPPPPQQKPQQQAPPPRQAPTPQQAPPIRASSGGEADGRLDAVLKLLPVYDSLARAVQHETDEAKRQGAEAILKQYQSILDGMGVQRIGTVGHRFDPHLHDARGHITDPGRGAGEIVQELEAGFIMNGRVLRFAKVIVAN